MNLVLSIALMVASLVIFGLAYLTHYLARRVGVLVKLVVRRADYLRAEAANSDCDIASDALSAHADALLSDLWDALEGF